MTTTRQRPEQIEPPANAPLRRCGRMFARAPYAFDIGSTDATTVRIFGEIGHDVTASEVADKINDAGGNDVTIKINSPGGSVDDGLAIYNMLVGHPGAVRVEILSVAASAASLIAMSGDVVTIAPTAFLMIHQVWGATVGNADDHAKQADTLKRFDVSLAETYSRRSGLPVAKIADMMRNESWMQGHEAVALGFAHGLLNGANASAQPAFNLGGVYQNVPAALAKSPPLPRVTIESRADLERELRRIGLASRAAKKVASAGFAALAGEESTAHELAALIAAATNELQF